MLGGGQEEDLGFGWVGTDILPIPPNLSLLIPMARVVCISLLVICFKMPADKERK